MAKSREETQAEWAKNMQDAQKANPDSDIKLDTEWWKPAADIGFDIKDQVDEQTYAKLNETLDKLFNEDTTPVEKEKTMREALECLKDHPDLARRLDEMVKAAGPGLWNCLKGLREDANAGGK